MIILKLYRNRLTCKTQIGQNMNQIIQEDIKITRPRVEAMHYRISKLKSFFSPRNGVIIRDRAQQSQKVLGTSRFDITLKKCHHHLLNHQNTICGASSSLSLNAFMSVNLLMCDRYLSDVHHITRLWRSQSITYIVHH
jgi:hypothetical protein